METSPENPITTLFPTPPTKVEWTEERIKEVGELHATGMSARDIANEVSQRWGVYLTRNSIIGCYNRHININADARAAAAAARAKMPVPKRRISHATVEACQRRELAKAERNHWQDVYERGGSVELADLKRNQCRFIPGRDHLYCGHAVVSGTAYCGPHRALMYRDR